MAQEPASSLTLDARRTRRLLLARAVDEADTRGRLVSPVEREQIERAALYEVAGPNPAHPPDTARYLDERARRILEAVHNRDPHTAALQDSEPWQRWLGWGLPLLALVLGAVLERIDNPQQVNLLSPPLLAFLLWNLLVYLALLLKPLWSRRRRKRAAGPGGLAGLVRDWLGHRTPPREGRNVRTAVAVRFRLLWWRVAGALEGWRIAQILHASAAAWAVGVGLSIVLGGLVREYRVGWESTLLDVHQVHALLGAVFAPVVALLPLEGFTLEQLERLRFGSGADVGQAEARNWIALYLALLGLVVVVPRLLLALYAAARRRWLARALRVDVADAYFTELLARVSPARLVLAWMAAQGGPHQLVQRLWHEASAQPGEQGRRRRLLRTERGDELVAWEAPPLFVPQGQAAPGAGGEPAQRLEQVHAQADAMRDSNAEGEAEPANHADDAPDAAHEAHGRGHDAVGADAAAGQAASPAGATHLPARRDERLPARWLGRLQAWWEPPPRANAVAMQPEADLWLVALDAPEQLAPVRAQLHRLPRPVLLLNAGSADDGAALRQAAESARLPFEMLDLQASAGCWAWEDKLREAIARQLPQHKAAGSARLLEAWKLRHEERLDEAMRLLAEPLLQAAHEVQEVGSGAWSLRRLVSAQERDAGQQAQQQAMASLLARLAQMQEDRWTKVRHLYGLAPLPATAPDAASRDDRFVVRRPVDAPQAGMAGAASGAAAGVGIDLLAGGLTLGAGAALGAVVGGGAALLAAALNNRSAPGGATQVQLSDEMLQALCELSLLQYLAAALRTHDATCAEVPPAWRSEVVAVVEGRRASLRPIWDKARQRTPDMQLPGQMAGQLGAMARELLARLRPS